jgi:hypothetical protein
MQREQLKTHIGDALGEQCTRLLQGMLAVSAHKDMPPGFLLLPFLEPGAAGTGTFAALKGRLRKAKDKLLSKAFKRWAVVFFCQHSGCKDPLGAHPATAFELREPTETLRKLAPYLQALSTLVKVGAAVGNALQLPLPSRIPFVSDAVDAVAGAGGLLRSDLGELYGSVGEELGLEASASGAAAAAAGVAAGVAVAAAAAAVAAAGQEEQEAAYQAVKVALDTKRVGKKGSDWRSEHGLQLSTVMQQQVWCCKTCVAEADLETIRANLRKQSLSGAQGGGGGAAAAPAPRKQSMSNPMRALLAFLTQHNLVGLAVDLRELGAEAPEDLLELDEGDVASLKLKKLQVKKWAKMIAALKKSE